MPVPTYRMPQIAEAVGRLFRGAGNGPHRPVHRLRRHARHRHGGHAACARRSGRRCAWRSCRSPSAAAALAFVAACAMPRAKPGARETRAASTSRRSSTWTRDRLSIAREDGVDSRITASLPPGAASGAARDAGAAGRASTPAAAFDEIGRAREPNAPDTPLVRVLRPAGRRGVLDDVEIAVPGRRGADGAARSPFAKPSRRRQPARRPGEARRRRRESKRPRPT